MRISRTGEIIRAYLPAVCMVLYMSVLLLLLFGCASQQTQGAYSRPGTVPPPVESTVPIELKLLDASADGRPAWIDTPPTDEAGVQYLVGLSDLYASEREARERAMRNARTQFAQYTGVDVLDVDPHALMHDVINRYLRIKATRRL